MNKNKPDALFCKRCWTDPFTSVVGLPSNNSEKGKKVEIDLDKNVNDSWNWLTRNEHCRKQMTYSCLDDLFPINQFCVSFVG